MKALVSGDAGFIGSHMRSRLEIADWDVTGADLRTGLDCRHIYATSIGFDLAVHCAAHVGGRADIDGRPAYIAAYNSGLDAAMFEWALRTRTRVVYFSSSAAYPAEAQTGPGKLSELEIDPADPLPAESSYGQVKLWGEYLADRVRAEGIPVHVLRPFSGYGPGQSLDYPFPAFIDRARRRADPFEVWGPGTQVRDFVHVDDLAETVLAVVGEDCQEPVNIGSGVGTSFLDLARMVCAAVGYEPEIVTHPEKPTGVMHRVADVTRMHTLHVPKVSLEEGIARALEVA